MAGLLLLRGADLFRRVLKLQSQQTPASWASGAWGPVRKLQCWGCLLRGTVDTPRSAFEMQHLQLNAREHHKSQNKTQKPHKDVVSFVIEHRRGPYSHQSHISAVQTAKHPKTNCCVTAQPKANQHPLQSNQ